MTKFRDQEVISQRNISLGALTIGLIGTSTGLLALYNVGGIFPWFYTVVSITILILGVRGILSSRKLYRHKSEEGTLDTTPIIRSSPIRRALGIGACVTGSLGIVLIMIVLLILLGNKSPGEAGAIFGRGLGFLTGSGLLAFVLIPVALLWWGITVLRPTTLRQAVDDLHSEDDTKRKEAVTRLTSIQWVPTTEIEHIDYLIAQDLWQQAVDFGDIGVKRVLETLTWEGPQLGKFFALGRSKNPLAIKALIDFLGDDASSDHSEDVIKALQELTGENFGANKEQWLDWYEHAYIAPVQTRNETITVSKPSHIAPVQTRNETITVSKPSREKRKGSRIKYLLRLLVSSFFGFYLAVITSLIVSGGGTAFNWYDLPLIILWIIVLWKVLSIKGPLKI